MSLEWDNLSSNSVADLKYACHKYGLKYNPKMKKENLVSLLEGFKSTHSNTIRRDENAFSNVQANPQNDAQKLLDMLHKVPPPKTPTVTPQKKTIWMHTPVQIFNGDKNNHLEVQNTPGYKHKVNHIIHNDDEPDVLIPLPPRIKPSIPFTPVVQTPHQKIILSSPAPVQKRVTIQRPFTSPSIARRSTRMIQPRMRQRRDHKKAVIISFIFFISLISLLLFLSQ